MLKRGIAYLLCLTLALALCGGARAEEMAEQQAIIVGSTTKLSGCFFTDAFGNNTADLDVRGLLHDYPTVAWTSAGGYAINPTAVLEAAATDNAAGDRTYTFTLAQDLTYCDGTPITARDYVFSALLLSSPALLEIGGANRSLGHLSGYAAFASGESAAFAGVRLINDYTFSLTIAAENLPYFYELAMVQITPYPVSVIAPGCEIMDDGDGAYISGPFTAEALTATILDEATGYLSHPAVTSGPYRLISYDKLSGVASFEINERYKGNYEGVVPTLRSLVFKEVKNDTMMDELAAGSVDIVNKVSLNSAITTGLEMVTAGTASAANYVRSGLSFLAFACEEGIFTSGNLRKAVAMCMDRQGLVDNLLGGYGVPVYGYYGYGQWMVQLMTEQLTNLNLYGLNLGAAAQLLTDDGWTLNQNGEQYNAEADALRYRAQEDGTLESLVIRFARTASSPVAAAVEAMLRDSLTAIGASLETTEMTMPELLTHYYRQAERGYDLFFLASNFSYIFDPYYTFNTDDAYQGVYNTSGLKDEKLMELAEKMRRIELRTEDADAAAAAAQSEDTEAALAEQAILYAEYLEAWLAFQQYFSEALPLVPLYSNIYFDFYNPMIGSYYPNAYWSWTAAIVYATWGVTEEPVVIGE